MKTKKTLEKSYLPLGKIFKKIILIDIVYKTNIELID